MGLRELFRHWTAGGSEKRTNAETDPGLRPESNPSFMEAEKRYREAAELAAAGRLPEAERALARALDCRHDHADALLLQGIVHRKQGRLEDAGDSLALAIHFRPDLAEAHFQLGLIAGAQRAYAEAERFYRQALEHDARHARAHNALGAVLVERHALEEGVESFRAAVAIDPDYAQAHSNLGSVLITRLDRFEEGAAHIDAAWRLAPEDRDVMCNRAMLLQYSGRLDGALALCDRLIAADPGADIVRLNRALALLKQGEFGRGWDEYEVRKRIAWEYVPRVFPVPEWKGDPLTGRRILVHSEQGLGDQIMFVSCLPDLVRLGGHCVVECAPKLEPILRRSFPDVTVLRSDNTPDGASTSELPAIDFHVAMGSLPLHFRRTLAAFPAHDGYLRADPGKVQAWRRRLSSLPGARKVGISWRGGMKSSRQSVRSVPLDEWLPILRGDDTAFVSLQYTDARAELEALERDHGIRVHHLQEAIKDYDETAALVCALDLVISVQTAIVHLSGALGRPVWVMVPAVAEWRYLQSGEHMPWYPSARLWRQQQAGEWSAVIAAIARAL